MSKIIVNKVVDSQTVSWEELKTYEFNELKDKKTRDVSKLKNSIVNSGFSFPFYCWDGHRYIIDGMGRELALKQLESEGYEIPNLPIVNIQADSLKEAKKLVLAVSSKHGEITDDSFKEFIDGIFDTDELKGLGEMELNIDQLDNIFNEPEIIKDQESEDDANTTLQKDPFVVRGDIFEIKTENNKYRIGCLDSTSIDDLTTLFDGETMDLVFTDPPYGVNITKAKKTYTSGVLGKLPEIAGDKDTTVARDFYNTCVSMGISNYILWGGNYFTEFLPASRCWLIWDKKVAKGMSFARGEIAYTSFDKNMNIFECAWSGNLDGKVDKGVEGMETTKVNGSSKTERVHPTQKPVQLQIDILNEYDEDYKNIFDGFIGGGFDVISWSTNKQECIC